MAEPSYLDGLVKELAAPLETKLAMIYKDFPPFKDHIITYGPEIFRFRKGGFGTKQRVIKNLLALRKGIPAYYKSATSSGLTLEIANTRKMPVELLGVYYKPADLLLPSNGKKIVVPQVANRLMEYEEIHFKFPPGFRWEEGKARDLELRFRVLGTRRETGCEVYPWQRLNDGFLKKGLTHRPANMKAFDFVTVDEGLAEVRFKPGQWVLKKSMIIPPGYTVIAAEGFRLKLLNFSAIVSRSPLQFLGSEENPIIISSAGSGQGLVVMDTARESLLDHVVIDGLSNPATEGWELTGAVTFYKAPLKMTSCRFSKNRCEDALNVVSSHFELVGCKFDSIFSDALDSDFCKGKIMDCVFTGCGNDAVDVSGSIIEAGDLFIDGVGDKGLSVGENSEMTALRISIKNA
ncbi:MAG: hypothetical protein GY757_40330, partial [bacterium]|nr:hypothetical protein [bacterium]